MPKPVCVPCQRFFRHKRNGFSFVEGMPVGGDPDNPAPPGTEAPERWRPYKLWNADLMECRGCGAQIVVGFAAQPVSEHYKPGFDEEVKRHGATLQVNDC